MAEQPIVPISNTPYPAVSNTSEATQILNKYGVDPNAVLSSANIATTTTNPTPAPDDLLGIRSALLESTGANAAYTDYLKAAAAANSASQGLATGLQQLSNRPVSMSKITGQQSQLRTVASNEINALTDAANLALQNYNAKKSEAESQFSIRESEVSQKRTLQAQYPGAKITLTDSFDTAIDKIGKYQKQVEKDTYKKTLKAKAMELGLKTSGSTKKLEKRISKYSKSALADAKKLSDLQLVKLQADIDNTLSEIANRGKSTGKASVYTDQEVTQAIDTMTQQYMQSGMSWQEAWANTASKLRSSGVDVTTGSYADNQLRSIFGFDVTKDPSKGTVSTGGSDIESLKKMFGVE